MKDGGEPGLAGWTIYAFADDGDGILEQAEFDAGAAGSAVTNASGNYTISGLAPGDYVLVEALQNGWFQSFPGGADELAAGLNTGAVTLGADGHAINLTSGESETAKDFGNFQKAKLSGYKYNDLDGDGQRDGGEPGLEGWEIKLYGDTDGGGTLNDLIGTTTTDANGYYEFTGLTPGDYRTEETLKGGWIQTDSSDPETLTSGENDTTGNDFGNFKKFCISGYKWDDTDGDGVWDTGELGIAGWTINLDKDNDGTIDATATTDATGKYKFGGLGPGEYKVTEENQTGWSPTFGGDGYVIVGQSGTNVKGRSGYAETPNFGNTEPKDPGQGLTPGFWKNHPAIFLQETGLDPNSTITDYEWLFGVDVTGSPGKYSPDPTLLQALGAKGGGEGALLRATTAGYANAASDDIHYCFNHPESFAKAVSDVTGLDPSDPAELAAFQAAYDGFLVTLNKIDTSDEPGGTGDVGCIETNEIIAAVQDLYNAGGIFSWSDLNKVASALDVMNNLHNVEKADLLP